MRFHRRNQKHIEGIFEKKTGVSVAGVKSRGKAGNISLSKDLSMSRNMGKSKAMSTDENWGISKDAGTSMGRGESGTISGFRKGLAFAAAVLCLVSLSAFAYSRFSGLNGDRLALESSYKGDGIFEIVVTNLSDKELELQKTVKLMRWLEGREVEGDSAKIRMEADTIAPHSEGTLRIDLSEGYDIALLEEELPEGDWYYLVLTNNDFAFGQDWICDIVFDTEQSASLIYGPQERAEVPEPQKYAEDCRLAYEDWIWPTESRTVSCLYGEQANGQVSDHINIAGQKGDEVYAVAEGVVAETGFEREYGNYIILQLENDVCVKYGHLKKSKVEEGESVSQGQIIGTMGQTGTATGPNLALKMTVGGEIMNPLAEIE